MSELDNTVVVICLYYVLYVSSQDGKPSSLGKSRDSHRLNSTLLNICSKEYLIDNWLGQFGEGVKYFKHQINIIGFIL